MEGYNLKLYIEHGMDNSGKGKFLQRLVPELEKLGVKCSYTDTNADVCLCLTRFRTKFKGPRILRVDGVLFTDDKRSIWNNGRVKSCIKKADAVIWQSPWCQKMGHGILRVKPKKEYVIMNGAREINEIKTGIFSGVPGFRHVIAIANWGERTHKRLKEMCEIMTDYIKGHPDVRFHVFGESKLVKKDDFPFVEFYGQLEDDVLRWYMSCSGIMLNLAYFDWNPNAVVEALVAGLPVVYCEGTGMQDLVGDSGVMVKDKSPKAKYQHVKHSGKKRYRPKVPKIDYEEVMAAIDKALKMPRVYRPDLFIENTAKKYKKVFCEVLGV